ncbi:MAG TPA: hypothetical protein VI030_01345 [Propionibacteriaceae bacterium]
MTLSILADDKKTTLEPSVVGENADKSIRDPSHRADVELPETVEYIFIGPPPGSSRRHVQYAAGLGVLAAAALTVWLLTANSSNDTGPTALISNTTAPQQAVLVSGQASAGGYASPLDPLAAYAQFCQNDPIQCVSTTPTALRDIGYVRFCQNSPTVCPVAKPN